MHWVKRFLPVRLLTKKEWGESLNDLHKDVSIFWLMHPPSTFWMHRKHVCFYFINPLKYSLILSLTGKVQLTAYSFQFCSVHFPIAASSWHSIAMSTPATKVQVDIFFNAGTHCFSIGSCTKNAPGTSSSVRLNSASPSASSGRLFNTPVKSYV